MTKIEYEVEIEEELYNKLEAMAIKKNVSVDELFERYVLEGIREMKKC